MKITATRIGYLQFSNCTKLPVSQLNTNARQNFFYKLFLFAGILLSTTIATAQWQPVDNAGFCAGSTHYIAFVNSPADGTSYTGYKNSGNSSKSTEMRDAANTITTLQPSSSYLCVVSAVSVPFTATGVFNEGNVFTAQLSDGSGSFANPTVIGTLASTKDTGTIQAITMGANAFYYDAQHYRIRVVSSNPAVTGSDNGADVKFYETQGGTRVANYRDADGDGYGDPGTVLYACSLLPGYISDGSDCNDNDASIHSPQTYYEDDDHDGYGSATAAQFCSYITPAGYSTNSLDCDDNNANINPLTVWVLDADGDGYYTSNPITQCTSPGTGYIIKTTQVPGDCSDNDATVHSPQNYYIDADKDGYGTGTAVQLCSSSAPVGYSTNNTDCNDSDASVHSPQTYYVDNDKDGYGSVITAQLCASTAPPGYSTNSMDCNDSNAAINPLTVWVLDNDKDGYYTGNVVTQCALPGTGYVIKTTQVAGDCNDNDVSVHSPQIFYVDNDKDGYGSTTTIMLCSSTAPVGYSTNNTDCNDNNASVNPSTIWVLDADKDGYYVSNPVIQCTSPGTGYVIKTNQVAGDCNDSDAGVHASILYYADADKDGYGAGPAVLFCTSKAPAGYSANNLDCNDKCATINPGMADGYDGIDNDCNGQTDEDFFQLSICDAGIYEGNSGQFYLYFTVSLNWIDCRTITVNYTTQNGTATAGSDYVAKSGTLTFPPGILVQTIAIPINGDKTVEPNETFQVVLNNPYNATLNRGAATGTIFNDDFSYSTAVAGGLKKDTKPTISLSPVPANTNVQVSVSGFKGKVMLQVFDMAGKQLQQQTVQASVAAIQQKINISQLAVGSYLLVVSDETGNRKTKKFIINR